MVGTNEMAPVYPVEIAFAIFSLVTSNFVYQVLFSEITTIIKNVFLQDTMYQEAIDQTYEAMQYVGLTTDEQKDIHYYFKLTKKTRQMQSEHDLFFQ